VRLDQFDPVAERIVEMTAVAALNRLVFCDSQSSCIAFVIVSTKLSCLCMEQSDGVMLLSPLASRLDCMINAFEYDFQNR
jgi:hypothetical protein